jgi:TolB-like protein
LCLTAKPGEVVSIDDLLGEVWPGVNVSPDSVYQAVAGLRRQLGDDPKHPVYIATVPRLGYRLVARVEEWAEETPAERRSKPRFAMGAGATIFLALAVAFALRSSPAVHGPQSGKSIAVLPFLDLTEGMSQEEFADGMTEELIDRLSKIPGLRVPSPTSSFFFKGKQITVPEIAEALGVGYVLDGSVRKSGGQVRVAARLVRAGSFYVIWSETYDRPFGDVLKVQDDIAGEVTRALSSSIGH